MIINPQTGEELQSQVLEKSIFKDKEDFVYYHYGSAMGQDENTVMFYYGRIIIEYRIKENKLINHETKDLEIFGDKYGMQADCMNDGFTDYIVVELYTKAQTYSDALIFFKYFYKTGKFKKFFEIPESEDIGFMHSYCKIDRNKVYGRADELMVFKISRKDDHAVADIYFVDLDCYKLKRRTQVRLELDKAYYRAVVFRPILLNLNELFMMQLVENSVMIVNRSTRKIEVVQHEEEAKFEKFIGVFEKSQVGKIKESIWSGDNYKFMDLGQGDLWAMYSDLTHTTFRVDQFKSFEDYAMIIQIMNRSEITTDNYFLDKLVHKK